MEPREFVFNTIREHLIEGIEFSSDYKDLRFWKIDSALTPCIKIGNYPDEAICKRSGITFDKSEIYLAALTAQRILKASGSIYQTFLLEFEDGYEIVIRSYNTDKVLERQFNDVRDLGSFYKHGFRFPKKIYCPECNERVEYEYHLRTGGMDTNRRLISFYYEKDCKPFSVGVCEECLIDFKVEGEKND